MGLEIQIDRPSPTFGEIVRLIQLAYECGSADPQLRKSASRTRVSETEIADPTEFANAMMMCANVCMNHFEIVTELISLQYTRKSGALFWWSCFRKSGSTLKALTISSAFLNL